MSKAKMHVNAHEADNDLQFLSYNQVTKLGYVQRRVTTPCFKKSPCSFNHYNGDLKVRH